MSEQSLISQVDEVRQKARRRLHPGSKGDLGQFLTAAPVATLMASMLGATGKEVTILDAGAGVGSLFAAAVEHLCTCLVPPRQIEVVAYEVDSALVEYLNHTATLSREFGKKFGIEVSVNVLHKDFIDTQANELFLKPADAKFDCAILNPPYKKIGAHSTTRKALSRLDIETGNLYSAFIALSIQMVKAGGRLVAISPRSFCNGPYFKAFRKLLLRNMALERVHLFESRNRAFRDDDVLQENVIISAVKGATQADVSITASFAEDVSRATLHQVPFERIIHPGDNDLFIHLPHEQSEHLFKWMSDLPCSIADLGIEVSTGRVVDFRSEDLLMKDPVDGAVPLIYPTHLSSGQVTWPKCGKKPNAIRYVPSSDLFVPNGNYVLVKRFTAKEEARRIVATTLRASEFPFSHLGFENHLNYFHQAGCGLELDLAVGLAAYLNSPSVDSYFRLFSGHTQVNATDLRKLRYPRRSDLTAFGRNCLAQEETMGPGRFHAGYDANHAVT